MEGQRWVTRASLLADHRTEIRELEPDLYGIGLTPSFAIGQRALLVRTTAGNLLWDCVPLLDDGTTRLIGDLGGLAAIAISHPHFYSTKVEWSRAFGGVPVYVHGTDRHWVMRPDRGIVFWEGESKSVLSGLTLVHCGGHFAGSSVLHWERGALLSADTIAVVADRSHVSFMYSYPRSARRRGCPGHRRGRAAVRVRPCLRRLVGSRDPA